MPCGMGKHIGLKQIGYKDIFIHQREISGTHR